MKKVFWIITALLPVLFMACDDEPLQIGSTIVPSSDHVQLSSAVFEIPSKSLAVDSVLARNGVAYLGRIRDAETDAYLTANFLTQFHVIEEYQLVPIDEIVSRDKDGKIIADSVILSFYVDKYFGDSLNQMQVTTYEMSEPVEEGISYYSNADPKKEGLIRPYKADGTGGLKLTTAWCAVDQTVSDSLRQQYYASVKIPANQPYTDKAGNTYNNYGSYILQSIYEHPEYFKNSYEFIHHVCPGFYLETTNGIGTMVQIPFSQLSMWIRYQDNDSIGKTVINLHGTDEVLQFSSLDNDKKRIQELADDKTCTWLKTPAGVFSEYTIPVNEIFIGHERDSISSASISLQCYNPTDKSEYALSAPEQLMLIEKDSVETFFEKSKVVDNERTYLAQLATATNSYTFSNISSLITKLHINRTNGGDNWEAQHPNWNKVVAIPVTATMNTSGVCTRIVHDMTFKSARLIGGSNSKFDPIKLNVVYTKFSE